MGTQGRQIEEAESFRAFSRRIKSRSMVEKFDKALASLTAALSAGKELEKCVLDDVAKAIRDIDDLNERIKDSSISQPEPDANLEEIITRCIQRIHDHTALLIKGKEITDTEKKKVDGTRSFGDGLLWLETAVNKVKDKLQEDTIKMRYNNLNPLLRRCLLFLVVFPGDAVISKRSIIYRWIGEGLIKPNKSQTAEQAGEQCFKMLLLSGLILRISKKHDIRPRCCIFPSSVKKMLEEVLRTKAKEVGFYFKTYDKEDLTAKDDKDDERPLSCLPATKNEQSVIVSSVSLKHKTSELLSLFNLSAQYLKCESDKFSKFKSIKVLQLGEWQIFPDRQLGKRPIFSDRHIEVADTKFLESLGTMKDLRYLSLQGISRITTLPDSLERLINLQILDLRACHNLEALPTRIGLLKNLTHLDVSECSLLDRMPKGLSSLSKLQVLKGFMISRNKTSDSCRLKELAVLTNLRKLTINIAGGAKANDGLKELTAVGTLSSLTITWGQVTQTPPESSPEISLPELEKLDLQCIPQHEKLNWLKPGGFRNLKKLYIRGGELQSLNLGTNGGKWNVETLRLKYLGNLECNQWSDIENTFSSLALLEIYECPKLVEKLPFHHGGDTVWIKKNGERWIPLEY